MISVTDFCFGLEKIINNFNDNVDSLTAIAFWRKANLNVIFTSHRQWKRWLQNHTGFQKLPQVYITQLPIF